jgi:xanthine dehydrogenase accessory factor
MPAPLLIVLGASPVAVALAELAPRFGYRVTVCALPEDQGLFANADQRIEGFALPVVSDAPRFVVVSTQGRGDEAALKAALSVDADYVTFVGSRRKIESIRTSLTEKGMPDERFARLKGPAGLDLGAITPDEIALSILAEILAHRRRGQRGQSPEP